MTSDAFRDALAKGLGRPVLALQREDPAPYADAILAACVENLQFDRQCEENRASYVMRLVNLAGLEKRALAAILAALPKSEAGWDRDWMIDLLEEFARRGEGEAWEALRALAAAGETRAQDNLATADEAGLAWVAENGLPSLPEDERYRIVFWLPDEEEDDATPLQRRLRELLKENDARRDARRTTQTPAKPRPKARDAIRDLDAGKTPRPSPYDFAEVATRREWRGMAERFLKADRRRTAWWIARAFRRRRFPLPSHRLFPHATHPERGFAACRILGEIDTPQVRHFTQGLMRRRPLPANAIEAATASLRPGDEPLVYEALASVAGAANGTRHDPVLDVVHLMHRYPKGRWQPHAEWIYEHSPCSWCRASAVDWMAERGVLSEAIREEAAYDAEPDIRESVETGMRRM